jgi:hypothetical protein
VVSAKPVLDYALTTFVFAKSIRELSMTKSTSEPGRFNWMLPLYAALVVVALYISMAFWAADADSSLLLAVVLNSRQRRFDSLRGHL